VTIALIGAGIAILLLFGALAGSDDDGGDDTRDQARQELSLASDAVDDGKLAAARRHLAAARDYDDTLAGLARVERELTAAVRAAEAARLDRRAYEGAVAALDAGRYAQAIRRFRSIPGYRDARALLGEARASLAADRRAERRRRALAEQRRLARQEQRRLAAEQRRQERIERELEEAEPPPAESGGGCDPNYGGCVPVASDVDCDGGSGDGPEYVSGPLPVTGSDVYGLDSDGDGTACE
jgi:hypothetical protein